MMSRRPTSRLEYWSDNATLTYHSDKPTGPTASSETVDVLEFLARVVSHIPNKGQVLQRYYGWYANRTRGIRRRAGAHEQPPAVEAESVPLSLPEARRRWAELLLRIFEVDPLRCSRSVSAARGSLRRVQYGLRRSVRPPLRILATSHRRGGREVSCLRHPRARLRPRALWCVQAKSICSGSGVSAATSVQVATRSAWRFGICGWTHGRDSRRI